jgi:glycosyltransferase involved in cell wall biosynthesis
MKQQLLEHCYSRDISNNNVVILGILPPPLGGVSVHIQRVKDKLEMQYNTVAVFNTEIRYRNWLFPFYLLKLFIWLLFQRPQIVMYHSSYVTTGILEIVCLAYAKKLLKFSLLIIDHDCRHLYQRSNVVKKLYQHALRNIDKLICIGNKTFMSYQDAQFTLPVYTIEEAFLPPIQVEKTRILARYPTELFEFIKTKKKIILANAAHCMRINGNDVYGLDLCIELMRNIKLTIDQCGLVIALAREGDNDYFKHILDSIKEHGLNNDIFILCGNYELWPLFEYAHLFVRPTLSDGASISIQEALYCNVPVVASDVCARPNGVQVFNISQSSSFLDCVKSILISPESSV